ncbi:hypothetical protein RHGRI_037261 [Rhododendron griersonianum]|uniref:Secreted protein n=1 Tax=Rhododendron griersonianum TaxID=479676 RepID=A0AAV6HRX8_9ERIC|nr:hypothetical protein RHGRI_037261 [Rhododendron griersonianum]
MWILHRSVIPVVATLIAVCGRENTGWCNYCSLFMVLTLYSQHSINVTVLCNKVALMSTGKQVELTPFAIPYCPVQSAWFVYVLRVPLLRSAG